MIAVDTNLLVYAHRKDSPWHAAAKVRIVALAEGRRPWGIPWPCLHEFLAIVTHPRVYRPPTSLDLALAQAELWLESPSLVLMAESEGYWRNLRDLLKEGLIAGPRVHDARIAALCLHHEIQELWTADRDFSRFPGIQVRNPLLEPE